MGVAVKYLCLGYYYPEKFEALSDEEQAAFGRECSPWDERLRQTGKLLVQASLQDRVARSIRPKKGQPSVTDGPFAETKELIGAFFIIEAENLDEAVRTASFHAASHCGEHLGCGVEVRPIESYDQH
jgi:hypothetical protein